MTRCRWWLAAGIAVVACRPAPFVCEQSSDCGDDPGAQCEANGYCSFPDASCPSGRRFSDHAGDVSGSCVPSEGSTTESATSGSSASSDGTSAGSTAGVADSTAGSTTTLGPSSTSDGTDSATGSESTGEPDPTPCTGAPLVTETFDAWPLDPAIWTWYPAPEATGGVVAGVMEVAVDAPADGAIAYGNIRGDGVTVPVDGEVILEVVQPPAPGLLANFGFGLLDPDVFYGFSISDGQLSTIVRLYPDPQVARVVVALNPVAHRWLRIAPLADGSLQWSTSADGTSWTQLDSEPAPEAAFNPAEARPHLYCGTYAGPLTADPLCRWDNLLVCDAP